MEKVLSVNNLSINFRTNNGQVQAVRNVSFDLNKGETMAIVGESGSGKSVTSRAILGILANNGIVKSGKIYYDGMDLLKISEDDFHKIRGDKIAMIFQDPMSSLNPIMRIGKQLTEAMLLKNKANRKESRAKFNRTMAKLVHYMDLTVMSPEISNEQKAKDFNKFEYKHLEIENAFNTAKSNLEEVISIIDNFLFEVEKKSYKNVKRYINDICHFAPRTKNEFLVVDTTSIEELVVRIELKLKDSIKESNYIEICSLCNEIKTILVENSTKIAPNFFSLAYYLTFVKPEVPTYDVKELDTITHAALDNDFMLEFIDRTIKALEYSHNESINNTKLALEALEKYLLIFNDANAESELLSHSKNVISLVEKSIDGLDIYRKSSAYTFKSTLLESIKIYLTAEKINKAFEKKYNSQKKAYDRAIEKGKTPSWNLIEPTYWDKNELKEEIISNVQLMIDYCKEYLNNKDVDFHSRAIDLIDYFKENASNIVTKVTKRSAKVKAIKLMEEVGISEPYKRYRQYPFEFSGGMRQRIVIAIALAANPQILICDEPTTALDVTIQSQILELINKLKVERNLSIIFITHDMGVVANMADRISVMYAGKIVETGTSEDIFYNPKHPYTWALLSSMPDLDTTEKLDSIPGTPPNMITPPVGDAFAERNKYAMKIDFEKQPPLFKVSDTHYAATWLLHPNAPKVEMPKTLVDRIERMKKAREAENDKQ